MLVRTVIRYFDLNRYVDAEQDCPKISESGPEVELPSFLLGARTNMVRHKTSDHEKEKNGGLLRPIEQFVMYSGTTLGIFLSSIAHHSGQPGAFNIQANAVLCLMLSFSVIPIVYRTLEIPSTAPFMIRFLMFVENGVFWQVIFEFGGRFTH